MPHPRANLLFTRAFTLVELMLAVVVSTLVIAAALAMFFTFERSDRALERRFDDAAQLERVHFVVERALSSLVVADSTRAPGEENPDAAPDAGSILSEAKRLAASRSTVRTPGGATVPGTAPKPEDTPPPDDTPTDRAKNKLPPSPPRILLEPAGDAPAPEPGTPAPQRLELVLMRSPVGDPRLTHEELERAARHSIFEDRARRRPAGSPSERSGDRDSDRGSSARDGNAKSPGDVNTGERRSEAARPDAGEASMEDTVLRAVRGSFELRHQQKVPVRGDGEPETRRAWELWWVPLAPRTQPLPEPGQAVEPPVPAGTPTRIASNIVALQWGAFDDREFKTRYAASYWNDLPAYFDVKIETLSGLTGHWLFEVDSVRGQEFSSGPDRRDAARASSAVNRPAASGTGSKGAEGGGK